MFDSAIKRFAKLIAVLMVLVVALRVEAIHQVQVVILKSDQLKSTNRSLYGARKVIDSEHENVVYTEFLLKQTDQIDQQIIDSIRSLNPALLLTVGSSATRLAKRNFQDVPIVFSSVKYPMLSGFVKTFDNPGGNVTGASLDIPLEVQFRTFKQIVPEMKKIGVLYTRHTEKLIVAARTQARKMGLTLVAVPVKENKELPRALDSLIRTVDGIWSVADPVLFTPQSTKYILLNTLRGNIPFMGFSRHVVESGALFALDFDYKAVGQQAGSIANRILNGERPKDIKVSLVDVLWFHYNEKTAGRVDVNIPASLVAVAKEVYR